MASGTKLKLTFETGMGQKTWTFNHAKPGASTSNIRNLMDTMITNGEIYHYPPLQRVSAVMETTTQAVIDVS